MPNFNNDEQSPEEMLAIEDRVQALEAQLIPATPYSLRHESNVRSMMQGYGQATPDAPCIPDAKTLILRARLKLEETLEFFDAAGLRLDFVIDGLTSERVKCDGLEQFRIEADPEHHPDLALMVDACADDSVVNTGTFVALGVKMQPALDAVDENNLLKIATGKKNPVTGKFEKAKDHPLTDFAKVLAEQGYHANATS